MTLFKTFPSLKPFNLPPIGAPKLEYIFLKNNNVFFKYPVDVEEEKESNTLGRFMGRVSSASQTFRQQALRMVSVPQKEREDIAAGGRLWFFVMFISSSVFVFLRTFEALVVSQMSRW